MIFYFLLISVISFSVLRLNSVFSVMDCGVFLHANKILFKWNWTDSFFLFKSYFSNYLDWQVCCPIWFDVVRWCFYFNYSINIKKLDHCLKPTFLVTCNFKILSLSAVLLDIVLTKILGISILLLTISGGSLFITFKAFQLTFFVIMIFYPTLNNSDQLSYHFLIMYGFRSLLSLSYSSSHLKYNQKLCIKFYLFWYIDRWKVSKIMSLEWS